MFFICARIFALCAFNDDLKILSFFGAKNSRCWCLFSAQTSEKKDARLMDDEGFYLRKGRRENVVISLSLSLSLSLSPKKEFEREKEEEHALQILLAKRALVSSKRRASKAPRAVERVCL